ncbi:MAG: CHASE3 domain-containing protein, partial [Bacteroidia bacterium]|nr:CHASE3 domain-containing protein [Bacteroidia bacterium]
MKLTLGRKILLGFIACGLILFGVSVFAFKNSEKFIASNNWIDHTNQVLSEFDMILVSATDAESCARGYVITGNTDYLESFAIANTKAAEHLAKVEELTKDNSTQQRNVAELERQVNARVSNLNSIIDLRKKDFEQAKQFVAAGDGQRIQNGIKRIIERAQKIEHLLLAERKQVSEAEGRNFNLVFIVLLLVILIILFIVYSIISSNLKALKKAEAESAAENWVLMGNTELNEKLSGEQSIQKLADSTIGFLCGYMNANIGTVYLLNDKDNTLVLSGQYAFSSPKDSKEKFALNEGLIGQCARSQKQISLTDLSEEQMRITSSVLNAKPKHLLITPFLFEGKTLGVIEIGKLTNFNEAEKKLINASMESIAVSINTALDQQSLRELLERIQLQKGEMEVTALELDQQISSLNRAAIVSIADANGDIIYVNDNFCKISKYSRAELLGKNHRILKSGKQQQDLFVGLWSTIASGKTWKGELLNKAKDGTLYWVDTTITPFMGIDGKIEKFVSIRFDISTTKNQMQELAFQNEEKEKRAAELGIANKELAFQSEEKEKRAAELGIANKELAFQNKEKEKRAEELSMANKELIVQGEELQAQQEELKQMNEELEEQSQNLKQQQEELQLSNEELGEQTASLEERNKEVETAKFDIEQKTKQLEVSSRYKSEFLANMSHELRTPLNSLLILSKDLSENKKENLDAVQVESAEIIYKSGHDLLVLINEVLDLSKIEAGKMSINIEKVSLKNFSDGLMRDFKHHAEQKGLDFTFTLDEKLPE